MTYLVDQLESQREIIYSCSQKELTLLINHSSICRTIWSNQKSFGFLRFQECLAFRWNWQKQTMFVGHELWDQRMNALDLHLIWQFPRPGIIFPSAWICPKRPRDVLQLGEIDWLQNIADSDRFSSEYASLTRTKPDGFFASKACWRMDSCWQCDSVISIDFYHSRCAWFLALKIWQLTSESFPARCED